MNTINELPSLNEFYKMLENHDWFYDYSDDHSVWRSGSQSMGAIRGAVETGPKEYKELFDAYQKYVNRKEGEDISKPTKPLRTKEEQIQDRNYIHKASQALEELSHHIVRLDIDQIVNHTQLWSLVNPVISMLHSLDHLANDKLNSVVSDTHVSKGYKSVKSFLDKHCS